MKLPNKRRDGIRTEVVGGGEDMEGVRRGGGGGEEIGGGERGVVGGGERGLGGGLGGDGKGG